MNKSFPVTDHSFSSIFSKNLRRVLLALCIPIILILSVASIFIISWQKEKLLTNANHSVEKFVAEMDQIWQERADIVFNLCYDSSVNAFRQYSDKKLTNKKIEALDVLQSRMKYIKLTSDIPADITLIFKNKETYLVDSDYAMSLKNSYIYENTASFYLNKLSLLRNTAELYTKQSIDDDDIIFYGKSQEINNIIVSSYIVSSKDTINRWIQQKLDYKEEILVIVDDNNNYITGNISNDSIESYLTSIDYVKSNINEIIEVNNLKYRSILHPSLIEGWNYILFYPIQDYLNTLRIMLISLISIMVLILGFAVFSSWRIALSIYRPIQIIMALLKSPEDGTTEYYQNYCKKYDEMKIISSLIQNSYFKELSIRNELIERKKDLRHAQNYALAAQINPHFIYNTLENINWKIINLLKEENEISTAMNDFSKLMRYTINSKGTVKLIDEIDNTRTYIKLCSSRSSVKFTTKWDIDSALLETVIPILVIQPLVENAITHGIKQMGEDGKIIIRCYEKDDVVSIQVEDNGKGISKEQQAEILKDFSEDMFEETLHIGLANTHHRLRLTFGDEWGLRIQSNPGKTIVSINIPKSGEKL